MVRKGWVNASQEHSLCSRGVKVRYKPKGSLSSTDAKKRNLLSNQLKKAGFGMEIPYSRYNSKGRLIVISVWVENKELIKEAKINFSKKIEIFLNKHWEQYIKFLNQMDRDKERTEYLNSPKAKQQVLEELNKYNSIWLPSIKHFMQKNKEIELENITTYDSIRIYPQLYYEHKINSIVKQYYPNAKRDNDNSYQILAYNIYEKPKY